MTNRNRTTEVHGRTTMQKPQLQRAAKAAGSAVAVLLAGALIMPTISAQYSSGATATGHLNTASGFAFSLDHQPTDAYDLELAPQLDPGQDVSKTVTVYNDSSIEAFVWLDSVAVVGDAAYSSALQGSVTSDVLLGDGPLAGLTTADAYLTLAANTSVPLELVVSLPIETGNEVLNQSATATFNFVAQAVEPVSAAAEPSAPQSVVGTAGLEQIGATWAAPADAGATAIDGYQVQVVDAVTGLKTQPWTDTRTAAEFSWAPGYFDAEYYGLNGDVKVKVRAHNSVGYGDWAFTEALSPVIVDGVYWFDSSMTESFVAVGDPSSPFRGQLYDQWLTIGMDQYEARGASFGTDQVIFDPLGIPTSGFYADAANGSPEGVYKVILDGSEQQLPGLATVPTFSTADVPVYTWTPPAEPQDGSAEYLVTWSVETYDTQGRLVSTTPMSMTFTVYVQEAGRPNDVTVNLSLADLAGGSVSFVPMDLLTRGTYGVGNPGVYRITPDGSEQALPGLVETGESVEWNPAYTFTPTETGYFTVYFPMESGFYDTEGGGDWITEWSNPMRISYNITD